eukprot:scaffold68700_cov65-Phaeocystis_antarctica.AAC.4
MWPPTAPEAHPLAQGCPLGPRRGPSALECRREAAAALPGPGQASTARLLGARRLPGRQEEARLLGRELAGVEHQPHPAGEARRRGEPARKASGARRGSCGRAGRDALAPREASEHTVYTRVT